MSLRQQFGIEEFETCWVRDVRDLPRDVLLVGESGVAQVVLHGGAGVGPAQYG